MHFIRGLHVISDYALCTITEAKILSARWAFVQLVVTQLQSLLKALYQDAEGGQTAQDILL